MNEFLEKVVKTVDARVTLTQCHARNFYWRVRPFIAESPVFVVGCSRAGTTLVYKALSESRELGSLQKESHDFWASLQPIEGRNWESHCVGPENARNRDRREASRHFFSQTGQRDFVDKNNQSGLSVPYLYALFPKARFVYVQRNPGDNIDSLIKGWGRPGAFATWSEHIPSVVAIEGGRYTQWCFFLPDGWRSYCRSSIEDVCAFQYKSINAAIIGARAEIPSDQWVEIKYENLIRDPTGEFRALFERTGLFFDEPLLERCVNVLSIPYNTFSEVSLDKWKKSKNRLKVERSLPLVEEIACDMGYGA